MASTLIIVTFAAGAAWGPSITITPTASLTACQKLQQVATDAIVATARSNVLSVTVSKSGKELAVTAGQSQRIMANLTCD